MPTDVTDDQVLRAMNRVQFSAADERDFRVFRNRMRHGVPECCILFEQVFIMPAPTMGDPEEVERVLDTPPGRRGLKYGCAVQTVLHGTYMAKVAQAAGRRLHYPPCPACFLAGKFVDVPDGCPCCLDREEFPPPEAATPGDKP